MSLLERSRPAGWPLVLSLFLCLPSQANSQQAHQEAPKSLEVHLQDGDGYRRWETLLPGRLLSSRTVLDERGKPLLLLLVAPTGGDKETPRALYAWKATDSKPQVEWLGTLPRDVRSLRSLHSGALGEALWLNGEEDLYSLSIQPGAITLGSAFLNSSARPPGPYARPRRALAGPSSTSGTLPLLDVGRLTLYTRTPEGSLQANTHLSLPVTASREARSLKLTSPPVTEMPRPEANSSLYLVGPEAQGDRRLRTVFLDPAADTPEAQRTEAWSQLPAPEKVERSWYAWLDGRPVMLVTTFRADKLGLFEKKKLRLFRLAADRSRSGLKPTLEILTESRRWFEIKPYILDVTGDGRDDLVVIQPEGLGGGELVVQTFVGLGGGLFRQTSRRSVIGLRTQEWIFGADFTGDEAADLVLLSEGKLYILAGKPEHQRRVLEKKPWKVLALEKADASVKFDISVGTSGSDGSMTIETHGDLSLRDTDGDGKEEIFLARRFEEGQTLVQLFSFSR